MNFKFIEASIILEIINLFSAFTNLFWTVRLKSIQAHKEFVEALQEDKSELEAIVKDLKDKRKDDKARYDELLGLYHHSEGQLKTYKKLHNHE